MPNYQFPCISHGIPVTIRQQKYFRNCVMLSFLAKYSSILLIVATLLGFLWPEASHAVFPSLPYVLFFLMLFTLVGIEQSSLLKVLRQKQCWVYSFLHSIGMTVIAATLAIAFDASESLLIAIVAVTATGSLFATPAIARSVGLDALSAMAMTIATTLMMPLVLYVNLLIFQSDGFTLDMANYSLRLLIFIVCPMAFSALVYRLVPRQTLTRVHGKLSQLTIILVFAFPFGLIGPYRDIFDASPTLAGQYLAIAISLCFLFFIVCAALYFRQGRNTALLTAITSANRNVLLTFTVAGSYLGPDFLILLGALQIPTYALPLFIRWINNYITTRDYSPQTNHPE